MSTLQKAAVLLPVVLRSEDFQLCMVIPTGKQAFREQEGISWKSCTASTLFPVPSVFHNRIELTPQLVYDKLHFCLVCYLRLAVLSCVTPSWEDRHSLIGLETDQTGPLPRSCLSSGTCL